MRLLPSTLTGWVVFYVFILTLTIIGAWIVTGKVPPAELTAFVSLVVTGFLALVRGEDGVKRQDPKDQGPPHAPEP